METEIGMYPHTGCFCFPEKCFNEMTAGKPNYSARKYLIILMTHFFFFFFLVLLYKAVEKKITKHASFRNIMELTFRKIIR